MENLLKPVDRVEVTVLVDNYIDMFVPQLTSMDRRLPVDPGRHILAEHGLSCLVRVLSGKKEYGVLFDTGLSCDCMAWNARQLGISLGRIEAVVLSHGHADHTGGLPGLLSGAGRKIPLIAHPDAFLKRRMTGPKGILNLPELDATLLKNAGADIHLHSGTSTLADGHLLVSGEVERKTEFEKGMPGMEEYIDHHWVQDPINDDQALIMNVQDKGLVVISGCAHAGIINTVEHAKKITGVDEVYAVMGGFHLTGPVFVPIIPTTVNAMKRINPDYIVPMHCTGWDAINRFADAMPGKFILNTVGTTYGF